MTSYHELGNLRQVIRTKFMSVGVLLLCPPRVAKLDIVVTARISVASFLIFCAIFMEWTALRCVLGTKLRQGTMSLRELNTFFVVDCDVGRF